MLTITHPHAELSARFRSIIICLCAVVTAYIGADFTAGPLVGAVYMRLRRLSLRFEAVLAGLGATMRPARRRAPCAGMVRARTPDLFPRRRGWLADLLQHEAAGFGGYDGRLGYLLRDPAMVALLAANPQVGRVLRPLWRMLSKDKLPKVLRPSPPPPPKAVDAAADLSADEAAPEALPGPYCADRAQARADVTESEPPLGG